MAIFYPFSRSPKVDSGALEKRDSTADSVLPTAGILTAVAAGMAGCRRPAREKRRGSLSPLSAVHRDPGLARIVSAIIQISARCRRPPRHRRDAGPELPRVS